MFLLNTRQGIEGDKRLNSLQTFLDMNLLTVFFLTLLTRVLLTSLCKKGSMNTHISIFLKLKSITSV